MKWKNKEVEDLTDDQLQSAKATLAFMKTTRNERLKERQKRHEKIDFTNPNFDNLCKEIDQEIVKRGYHG